MRAPLLLGALMMGFVFDPVGTPAEGMEQPGITNFAQLHRLSAEESARGRSVRVRATVLCYDAAWGQLYFHDGRETKWLSPTLFPRAFEPGDIVEIAATTDSKEGTAGLTNVLAQVVGHQELPAAVPRRLADFSKDFGQWVETTGQVRVVDDSWGRLALVIAEAGQSCLIYVTDPTPTRDLNWKQWIGCQVRVRGINASKIVKGQLARASLFVPRLRELSVIKGSKVEPHALAVVAIDRLLSRELGAWTNEMVHVNGIVSSYKPGVSIDLRDPTGLIAAEVVQMTRILEEQRVDLWGFPVVTMDGLVLKDSYFEPVGAPEEAQPTPGAGAGEESPGLGVALTNVSQVIHLSKGLAAARVPVFLRGVVTYADPEWHSLFFHDESGEIYVDSDQQEVHSGQWVELRGHTSGGGFAPEIKAARIEVLGTSNLPPAVKVDLADLANGHLDGHWVELEGVVRRVVQQGNHLDLSLMSPRGRFRAILPSLAEAQAAEKLVDCLVSIQGACGAQLNMHGQLSGITLHVPALAQIRILDAVPADPFAVRSSPIAAVARFDPERRAGRRVKISGTVIMVLPQEGFYLQDQTGGLRVDNKDSGGLAVGDAVDVLGFPVMGDFAPKIDEAIYRRRGPGEMPPARPLTAERVLVKGEGDGQLIEMQARLVQDVLHSARPKLFLQDGDVLFTASLYDAAPGRRFPAWKAGSLLRLRGTCSIQGDDSHEPQGFRLLLGRRQDVELLKAAPWWGLRQTLFLLATLGCGTAAACAWIFLLRRQVRAQTAVLRENQQELLQISRQAGMAEVATSVLHNVGNVLNSINVSSSLLDEHVRKSRSQGLERLARLLEENAADLGSFFSRDPRGAKIPGFLTHLAQRRAEEQSFILEELAVLRKNVGHVKDIVAMQQSYANVYGVMETVDLSELVEDSLRMNAESLARHAVRVQREYGPSVPAINTDKHKVMQILVNLITNAQRACDESDHTDKRLTVRVAQASQTVTVSIIDNGVGIPAENLNRIFNHGFTTRKDGHGFGLHSGALFAKELGGSLSVQSQGPGLGAAFTLVLPLRPPARSEARE